MELKLAVQASIGFAIPITEMFQGRVVWRGVVYSALMTLAKMSTGLWLIRYSSLFSLDSFAKPFKVFLALITPHVHRPEKVRIERGRRHPPEQREPSSDIQHNTTDSSTQSQSTPSLPPKPKSLYPACILSLAMVARGEVGYLIASLAESNGIFGETPDGPSETYLVVVWAISFCTLVGPISVGSMVKRVKALSMQRTNTGSPDPLGVWGI